MKTQITSSHTAMAARIFLASLAIVIPAQSQPSLSAFYDFVKLDYPNAPVSFPLGINQSRQIVGLRIDSQGVNHGYLYQNGMFTDIDYPGGAQFPGGGTSTGGINDAGDIAGLFTDAQGFQHGFLRTMPPGCAVTTQDAACKPVYKQIDVPGAVQTKGIPYETGTGLGTAGIGINNRQAMVGIYAAAGLYSAGFELSNGKFTTVDDPAATHTPGLGDVLFSINDFGVIAGAYAKQSSPTSAVLVNGFLFDGRDYVPVMVPGSEKGGFGTQVSGINNFFEAVGVFSDPAGTYHGFLWLGGQSFTIDYPNAPYSECHAINNRGDITGAYLTDPSGYSYHGFVAFLKQPR